MFTRYRGQLLTDMIDGKKLGLQSGVFAVVLDVAQVRTHANQLSWLVPWENVRDILIENANMSFVVSGNL